MTRAGTAANRPQARSGIGKLYLFFRCCAGTAAFSTNPRVSRWSFYGMDRRVEFADNDCELRLRRAVRATILIWREGRAEPAAAATPASLAAATTAGING